MTFRPTRLSAAGRSALLAGLVATFACSPSTPEADGPSVSLRETDVLLEIEGATPEAPALLAFELDEPRHVTLRSVFSPVKVSWEVRDENGSRVSTRGRPLLSAGRYTVSLTPREATGEPLLLKILTAPAREPKPTAEAAATRNETAEEAFALEPDSAVRLSDAPDQSQHWFQVETTEEGVLVARVEGGSGSENVELWPVVGEGEAQSRVLAMSQGAHTVHAKVPAGSYYVVVRGAPETNPAPGAVIKVMHRTLNDRPTGGVGIMTIGMSPEAAAGSSLGQIAEATGLPLISTQSADDILWVLATAIGEELGTDPRWALPGFLVAAGLLFGLAEQLKRRRIAWTAGALDAPGDES